MAKKKIEKDEIKGAFPELEAGVYAALETYSNVHRGSGHNSMVSTHLFEQARDIILEYLELKKGGYIVVFCTPRRADVLIEQLNKGTYKVVSSRDIGLSIGIKAIAVNKKALPKGITFQTGGGTARLVAQDWVVWAKAPDKLEAGTPAIINVIAFAKALLLIRKFGKDIFRNPSMEKLTKDEILYQDELMEYKGQELLDKLRDTLIGSSMQVPTMEGLKPYINLDNSASTPTFLPIWNTFRQTLNQAAEIQSEIVKEVMSISAEMLGAPLTAYDLVFTSNTTEAINLTAESLNREIDSNTEPVVVNTLLEHSSNDLPWRSVTAGSVIRISVDADGFLDSTELETKLSSYNKYNQHGKKRIKLVAVSGASNVLGVCNDISAISRIVHKYGAKLLVDGAQLIAHRKVDIEGWGIDYLAFSAHKVYAPFGCGILVARKGLLNFSAAELEKIQLSGEDNAGGIAALGKAFVILQRIGMNVVHDKEQALTKRVLGGLSQIPGLKIHGMEDPESPGFTQKLGVIVFELKGIMAPKIGKELAVQMGIGVRFGCHCAHVLVKHLLKIGPKLEKFQWLIVTLFPKLNLPGLTRISLGIENNEEDVDNLVKALSNIKKNSKITSASKSDIQKKMKDFVNDRSMKVFSQLE